MKLQDLIAGDGPIVADGGMGTTLISMGLEHGETPELWNVEKADNIRSIHQAYVDAGAQIILTNTFGGTRARLSMNGLEDRCVELNTAAAKLAREVADQSENEVVVGGSMGPTGQLFAPMGTMTVEDATAMFAEQAKALVDGGVDVLWIETMSDLQEVKAAVEGCKQAAPDTPFVITMTFDTNGRTMMGVKPEQAIEALADLGAVAVGGNCGNGPEEIEDVITKMRDINPDAVLIAKANAGLPRMEGGQTIYDATPAVMGEYAKKVRANGARIIGACCGSTADHVAAIAKALKEDA